MVSRETLKRLSDLAAAAADSTRLDAFDDLLLQYPDGATRAGETVLIARNLEDMPPEALVARLDVIRQPGAHPVDRVAACLFVMQALETGRLGDALNGFGLGEVHFELSRTLIDYPVLMDRRLSLYVPTRFGCSINSVLSALAYASYGSLPCAAQGFSEAALTAFATHPCVARAILTYLPWTLDPAEDASSPQTFVDEAALQWQAEVPNATRGAFMASLFELSALSARAGKTELLQPAWGYTNERTPFKLAARTFWDLAAHDGAHSGLTVDQFVAALRMDSLKGMSGLAEPGAAFSSMLSDAITLQLEDSLTILEPRHVGKAVVGAAGVLRALGIVSDDIDAADYLFDATVGLWRVEDSVSVSPAPDFAAEAILSFFDAIQQLSPTFDIGKPSVIDDADEYIHHGYLDTWKAMRAGAITRASMRKAISQNAPQGQAQSARLARRAV